MPLPTMQTVGGGEASVDSEKMRGCKQRKRRIRKLKLGLGSEYIFVPLGFSRGNLSPFPRRKYRYLYTASVIKQPSSTIL